MITKLRLKNWKSFKDSTVYIDPLTILIGVNASGKSNVLDAFDFIKKLYSTSFTFKDAIRTIRGGNDYAIKRGENAFCIDIDISENDRIFYYSIIIEKKDSDFVIKEQKIKSGNRSIAYIGGAFQKIETTNVSSVSMDNKDVIKMAEFANTLIDVVTKNLQSIFVFNPVPEKMRGYSPVSSELKPDGSNIAGVIASLPKDEKEKLEAELTKYVSPLPEKDIRKIQSVTVGLNNSDAMLYCYEEWNPDKPIDARGMSDGTLRFAAIVLALLTAKPHSLLVIEEIDNGLHPSRAKELVKVMKELSQKRSVDILCTTHNPVLINELGNDMIPFISYVKRDNEGNSVIELLEEKDNLAKLMASSTIGGIMTEDKL